jgi:hypothetical protein
MPFKHRREDMHLHEFWVAITTLGATGNRTEQALQEFRNLSVVCRMGAQSLPYGSINVFFSVAFWQQNVQTLE